MRLEGVPKFEAFNGRFLELKRSKLIWSKCTFYAAILICRLQRSISSNFGAIQSWNVHHSQKLQKKH